MCKNKKENGIQTKNLTAIVDVPQEALSLGEDGAIALEAMEALNGTEVIVFDEDSYIGEVGVDWDKYDFFTPFSESISTDDGYSWKKEWLSFSHLDLYHIADNEGEFLSTQPYSKEQLFSVVLEMAQEQEFEMISTEAGAWINYIELGEKGSSGYLMGDWKKEAKEEAKMRVCSEILSAFGNHIYHNYEELKIAA